MSRTETPAPILVRTASPGRGPGALTAALVVLLLVAVAKPWAGAPSEPAPTPAHRAVPTAGVAAMSPAPARAPARTTADEYCLSQTSWMVAGIMVWGSTRVRTWEAIRPVAAAGPLDSAIQFGLIVSRSVWAVGYCAPVDSSPAGPAVVSAWLITPAGGASPVALRPWRPEVPASSLGELYVDAAGGSGGNWPEGRFVFAVADSEGGPTDWFGVDVVDFIGSPSRPTTR